MGSECERSYKLYNYYQFLIRSGKTHYKKELEKHEKIIKENQKKELKHC